MATRTDEAPEFPFGTSPFRHSFIVVLWAVWAALNVNEYVGDAFEFPAFLLALLTGVLLGVALFAWVTRTKHGEKARRLYDDAPLGQQLLVSVVLSVLLIALVFGLDTTDVSPLLLQVAFISVIFGYHQSKFASAYARLE
ncbi:hypothetical protein [Halococcus saccharolyticus]|uniref:Uncharacterized protein n=1 Tax=Halococcus saccharolyticus DSM 5350 TaxID=1227455 RepID=M0MQH2_9EURY|nr:hypothetical protein [Halococcus saccharolyticus]EMA47573.1 hypothetical protein C449_01366 [Halococcus saccharolyticus DSM 5350]